MSERKPTFTLRGHRTGLSCVAHYQPNSGDNHSQLSYLLTGDDCGCMIIWDLATFKPLVRYDDDDNRLFKSAIQSMKIVNILAKNKATDIIVAQSRDEGVHLIDFIDSEVTNMMKSAPVVLASFPTHESLFSRGDAKSIGDGRAILAHSSVLDSSLVTIRIVGRDAKTELSGTAGNLKKGANNPPVFDIVVNDLKVNHMHVVFVAYENGFIHMYCVQIDDLNCQKLDVKLLKKIDLGFRDFVSAYDVCPLDSNEYLLVAGSPGKDLCVLPRAGYNQDDPIIRRVRLKSSGVSAVALSEDGRLAAIASWNNSVRFYSLEDEKFFYDLNCHTKPVQSVVFVPNLTGYDEPEATTNDSEDVANKYLVCCASQDGTTSVVQL